MKHYLNKYQQIYQQMFAKTNLMQMAFKQSLGEINDERNGVGANVVGRTLMKCPKCK